MLSEAYGGEAMGKSSVFEWHKRLKEGRKEAEDDVVIQDLTEPMEMLKKCATWWILQGETVNQAYYVEI
jgi:TPP-dependent trihydroxycyclohexane-1,2-dione (THcHDO) dehydratase